MEDWAAAALRQAERVAAIKQEAERRQSLLKNEGASSADAGTATGDDANGPSARSVRLPQCRR